MNKYYYLNENFDEILELGEFNTIVDAMEHDENCSWYFSYESLYDFNIEMNKILDENKKNINDYFVFNLDGSFYNAGSYDSSNDFFYANDKYDLVMFGKKDVFEKLQTSINQILDIISLDEKIEIDNYLDDLNNLEKSI